MRASLQRGRSNTSVGVKIAIWMKCQIVLVSTFTSHDSPELAVWQNAEGSPFTAILQALQQAELLPCNTYYWRLANFART